MFAEEQHPPGFSPGANPVKNQQAGPVGVAEWDALPCEQWAAPNGALGGEPRRNKDGGVPVDDSVPQYEEV